jgi:regulator of sigma E protease
VLTLLAFLFALTLLIAVHEYGHYRMAVAFKVPVLVFSIGFGKTIFRWRPKKPRPGQNTEFIIGMLPLGGFIQMLDSREANVEPALLPLAFDQRSVKVRAAIVAAGPLANLILAGALFTCLAWWGQPQALPILSSPTPGSWAAQAGLTGGERVLALQIEGQTPQEVRHFQNLLASATESEMANASMVWTLQRADSLKNFELEIPSPEQLKRPNLDENGTGLGFWTALGFRGPLSPPVIGRLEEDGAAKLAGLQSGDRVLRVDGKSVVDAQQLRDWIRAEPASMNGAQTWEIERAGQLITLSVQPKLPLVQGAGQTTPFRRIGAVVGAAPETDWVQMGFTEGIAQGFGRVLQIGQMTVNLIGKMLTGSASSKHLSGPLTIAEQAGQSAQLGWAPYLTYLALISVSLGLLNLLPLPMLDGGHLMYYLWESLTGKPVSVAWQRGLQKVGLALLIFIMTLAFFNDLTRLFN